MAKNAATHLPSAPPPTDEPAPSRPSLAPVIEINVRHVGRKPQPQTLIGPVVVFAALIFAGVHLYQPGVSWLQLACITSTGMLYGWIRWRSGSTAPAAVAHAAYNLALYAISAAMSLGEKAVIQL